MAELNDYLSPEGLDTQTRYQVLDRWKNTSDRNRPRAYSLLVSTFGQDMADRYLRDPSLVTRDLNSLKSTYDSATTQGSQDMQRADNLAQIKDGVTLALTRLYGVNSAATRTMTERQRNQAQVLRNRIETWVEEAMADYQAPLGQGNAAQTPAIQSLVQTLAPQLQQSLGSQQAIGRVNVSSAATGADPLGALNLTSNINRPALQPFTPPAPDAGGFGNLLSTTQPSSTLPTVEDPNVTSPTMIGGSLHIPPASTPTGGTWGYGGQAPDQPYNPLDPGGSGGSWDYGGPPPNQPYNPLDPYNTIGPATGGNGPSAGPSAGPSQGPNLGMVWPGYNNPNLDAQYATWRDARRAAGQDPYDMNAFRQHLIAIGSPDPGVPNPVSPNAPPSAATPPATTSPTIAPTTSTPPTVTPPTPTGPTPGATWNPELRTGNAQSIMSQGMQGLSGLGAEDIDRLFPFFASEGSAADPTFAARNTLKGFGFDTTAGNPFVDFMESILPGSATRQQYQNVLGGVTDPTSNQTVMGTLGGGIRYNRDPSFNTRLLDLQKQYRTDPTKGTAEQRALAERSLDPGEAWSLYNMNRSGDPAFFNQNVQNRVFQRLYDTYRNQAGANAGAGAPSYLEFIMGLGG